MNDVRSRIVEAAADLLASEGREAVSTRAVSAAAGVQVPAIYRQFGDMRSLLHAAAGAVLARWIRQKKTLSPAKDPLEDLRRGWDMAVAFGLANPAAFQLMYAEADPPDEAREGYAMLESKVARLAATGQLRVTVELAARMIHASACGVTLSLIGMPAADRDRALSVSTREGIFAAIMLPQTERQLANVLSAAERQLLGEWLRRLEPP